MEEMEFEAAVGMSRKWDARDAGREVAKDTIKNLKYPPDFVLLFTTIHYKKKGNFDEFLKGFRSIIPQGIPVAGGTVAGFMTQKGAFSRGAVAVSVNGNLKVNVSFARGTRTNPKKVSAQIKKNIMFNNDSLLLAFLPGPSMPNVRKGEKLIVTKSKALAKLAPEISRLSTVILNKGAGREMEVLKYLSEETNMDVVGCSTIDDNNYDDNFQFFNDRSFSNSLVVLELNKIKYHLETIGMMPIPEKWHRVDKKRIFGHLLEKVEGKSALSFYLDELGYTSELIFEEPDLVHRRFVFAPILTKDEYGEIHPRCPGTFYGDNIGLGHPVFDFVGISITDGEYINNQFIKFLNKFNQEETKFLLIFSCAVLFEALGNRIFKIHDKFNEIVKNDFLVVFGGGEIISEKDHRSKSKILEMSLTGIGFL